MRFASLLLPLLGACYASSSTAPPAKLAPPAPAAAAAKEAPHATAVGKVTLDGKPVPYFGISLPTSGFDVWSVKAFDSANGTFSIALYEEGAHDVIVVGPGFARRTLREQDMTFGRTTDLGTIEVEHGLTIDGLVTDDTGAPVRDAMIRIDDIERPIDDAEDPLMRLARGAHLDTTDAHGRYRIDGIEGHDYRRNSFRVWVRAPDKNLAAWPVRMPSRSTTLDLVVAPAGSIEIAVTVPEDHSFYSDYVWVQPLTNASAGVLFHAADTRRIDSVAAGTYLVSYMTTGQQTQPSQTITVTPSATTAVAFKIP